MTRPDLTRDLPILMLSERSLPQDRAEAERVGATSYLVKPFTALEFLSTVSALLKPLPQAPQVGANLK